MAYIDVKNKKGTGGNTPPSGYSSWLDLWEKKKGKKATGCEALNCTGGADVGGHVIKAGQGAKEYILIEKQGNGYRRRHTSRGL